MTLSTQLSTRPAVATLSVQWLVLIVITLGIIVSSIGLMSSHGLAVVAASHDSVSLSTDDFHGHVHSNHGVELSEASKSSSAAHPHHGMDHSHDIAHELPLAWGAGSPQLPSWEIAVRPWIDMGQAYRLDRPPMG